MDWNALRAPFPHDKVSWRAQSVTKAEPFRGMALAYIDARDVMDRLDEVCGPDGWQDTYVETAKGRLLCVLSLRVNGEWLSKSDGAGESDIEGEKGAISGALKRAAVKWGIGRYLYGMPSPWVPCETFNGKWKRWTADPWVYVKGEPKPPVIDVTPQQALPPPDPAPVVTAAEWCNAMAQKAGGADNTINLDAWWRRIEANRTKAEKEAPDAYRRLVQSYRNARAKLAAAELAPVDHGELAAHP